MKLTGFKLQDDRSKPQFAGALYSSEGTIYLVPFPHALTEGQSRFLGSIPGDGSNKLEILDMDKPEWEIFLQRTGRVEVLEQAVNGGLDNAKALRRRRNGRRQAIQNISWRVYKRDEFRCRFCGVDGIPMTVDHVIPLVKGGPTIEENLVTSCGPCNQAKGVFSYTEWLQHPYYKKSSQKLSSKVIEDNEALVHTLDKIPRTLPLPKR